MRHRLYAFPLLGALLGFAVGLLSTAGTQLSNLLVTGGKPILSIPPMTIITYEATLLGAIAFTVVGIVFESRLLRRGPCDRRIIEGFLEVLVNCRAQEVAYNFPEASAATLPNDEPPPVTRAVLPDSFH